MFADDIRRALSGTPRERLVELSAAVWKGFACGALQEGEAQQLAEEIAARKLVPPNTVRIVSPEWRAWLRMRDRRRADADDPRQTEVKRSASRLVSVRGDGVKSSAGLGNTDSLYRERRPAERKRLVGEEGRSMC